MQEVSGVALIVAAVLVLIASAGACRRAGDTWLTSDTFILTVVGPGSILSFTIGFGTLYYSRVHGESVLAAMVGLAFAAGIVVLAAMEWRHARRPGAAIGHSANVLEFTVQDTTRSARPTTPDAPRTRKAA